MNIIIFIYNDKVSAAVFSAQQHYSECASHHYYVNILLMSSSWDTHVSCAQYSSLSHSVSAFHFSRASMLTVLLIVLIIFLTDLAFTDLIFRTDFNKFINLSVFKIILMNSV